MSTITVTLASICSGGNHLTFNLTGAATRSLVVDLADLTAPITEADAETFCRVIARLAKQGRTAQQTKTLLQSGVAVSV